MNANTDLIYDVKRKMLAKYPRFGSEIAVANIEFKDNLKYHTAATDGKNIYVDPNYFASLSENDRLFIIAHEIMHIKFMHIFRLKDKSGVKRDLELWNKATDAIINANLERDGFIIKEGYENVPEALDYSAEEFYQKLLQEKKEQNNDNENSKQTENQNSKQTENQNSKQTENQNSDKGKGQSQGDDHSLWEKAFSEQQKQDSKSKEKRNKQRSESKKQEQEEQTKEEQSSMDFNEKREFKDNRKEKIKKI